MKLRVGTRPSKLALLQVKEIISQFPGHEFEIIHIYTSGDIDKETSLVEKEVTSFFSDKIEELLLKREIDFAVHSAKDLDGDIVPETEIVATTKAVSIYDCLVSKNNVPLNSLKKHAVIGTSSIRRQSAIKKYRSDLVAISLRGNVDERINKLDKGYYDGIIVAHAALLRLGLKNRISQIIPESIIEPHPLQGRLAIQALKERDDIKELFGGINEG